MHSAPDRFIEHPFSIFGSPHQMIFCIINAVTHSLETLPPKFRISSARGGTHFSPPFFQVGHANAISREIENKTTALPSTVKKWVGGRPSNKNETSLFLSKFNLVHYLASHDPSLFLLLTIRSYLSKLGKDLRRLDIQEIITLSHKTNWTSPDKDGQKFVTCENQERGGDPGWRICGTFLCQES